MTKASGDGDTPSPRDGGADAEPGEPLSPDSAGSETASRPSYTTQVTWAGPYPPPQVLAQYGEIVKDGPERIFREWEAENQHRRALEEREQQLNHRLEVLGRVSGGVVILVGFATSAFLGWLGHGSAAAIVGGATLVGIASAFIPTTRRASGGSRQAGPSE